ncbi:MFS general substrate transporter [Lepidopterella palustris CBS 459.81]|uniref:MFS general substrate transporter n=1 Tax=Lepidopterella palustris CBS 459.81 TaxID=1314670 RepID=A0A8E2J9D0_9PEZI|nr:MFS general substrate transporter [Lepidopterella palustris CBS 459.81]
MEKDINDQKPAEYLEKVDLQVSSGGFVRPSPTEEAAIIRKLDWHLLPLVFVLYSLSVLDRSNLGNAKLAGMAKDIDLNGNRYNWLGTCFYIAYILFQWTIMGWKHFPPHRWAAVVVFFWGFVATIQATAFNWGGLMTCRFFLGIAESMFGPGVPLYLSYFYPREKVGFRHGVFISGAAMANAYGGALAYGISQIRGNVAPWKILFIIEGVPTCLIATLAWFFLPDSIVATKFLNEREKAVATHFVARNQKAEEGTEKTGIRFKELLKAFKDPKSYIPGIMYFSCNVSFASLPLFVPTIISEMGAFTQIQSNGLSAPPYLLCFFTIIIICFLSDRFRMRGPFCALAALVGAIGFILQATTKSVVTRYFGVFLSVNIFASVALLLAWTANLHATESKRAGGYTILATIGQCGPLLGTNVFPASEKPYYRKGMWISCAFCLLVTVLSVALSAYLVRENRKMERAGLLVPQGSEMVDAPGNETFAERKVKYTY